MPTYEYKCESCEHVFEAEQRISENHLTDCPQCQKPELRRLISGGAGIAFKGNGFYINDSKSAPKTEACQTCPKAGNC